MVLRFFAEGGYQRGTGNDIGAGFGQSTFSKVLKETLNILNRVIVPIWVVGAMTPEEKNRAKRYFFQKNGFPGVIGAVDGTHIKIMAPNQCRKHLFYNRKHFFSINAAIVSNRGL